MPSFERRVPEGDDRERMICTNCGHIDYQNRKVIVGTVVTWHGNILMCRRAIEPRRGFWTLPAGYLELGETLEEGPAREAMEEATADISLDGILGVFSVARIGQVQVIFRGRFADPERPHFASGPESLEVALFAWNDIPWNEVAFPTVHWALNAWHACQSGPLGTPAGKPGLRSARRAWHRVEAMRGLAVVSFAMFAVAANAGEPPLPVPPIPPARPPLPLAPMPNPNVVRPEETTQGLSVTVDNGINHREAPDPGLAFLPGSHYQIDNDRRWLVWPGVTVHVAIP